MIDVLKIKICTITLGQRMRHHLWCQFLDHVILDLVCVTQENFTYVRHWLLNQCQLWGRIFRQDALHSHIFFFLRGRIWFYYIFLIILEPFWITHSEILVKLLVALPPISFLCLLGYSKILYWEFLNFSFSLLLTIFLKQTARRSTK